VQVSAWRSKISASGTAGLMRLAVWPASHRQARRKRLTQDVLGNWNERARIVENGFAASSGVSKSAKVVLGRVLIKSRLVTGT
jgi:hypothetical protein